MGQKLKIAGWIAVGAFAGALTTVSLQTTARANMSPLPLEELQQLAAVFSMVKSDYVEPVDDKKLVTDAITGMVASLDPHSQYFDKKTFKAVVAMDVDASLKIPKDSSAEVVSESLMGGKYVNVEFIIPIKSHQRPREPFTTCLFYPESCIKENRPWLKKNLKKTKHCFLNTINQSFLIKLDK